MIRRNLTAAQLVVLAFLLPACLEADSAERAAEYARLVEEYRVGNGDTAIRRLLAWKPASMVEAARDVALAPSGRPIINPGLFPAAIMLHSEAGLRLNHGGKGLEAVVHWSVAEMIARAPYSLDRPAFLRASYHALGHYFLGSNREGDAAALLEQGRRQFPDDPSITRKIARDYYTRLDRADRIAKADIINIGDAA